MAADTLQAEKMAKVSPLQALIAGD